MERFVGKVAIVTGASAGIGAAITKDLVKAGLTVVGLARRKERVDALLNDIAEGDRKGKLYSLKVDISSDEEVNAAFQWIEKELGAVYVLINNAGILRSSGITLDDNNEDDLKAVINTNLWGLVLATKRAVSSMKKHNVISGHIVNINSVGGHKVFSMPGKPQSNVYYSTKFGVTALTEVLRQEFNFDTLKTKVTSISPGYVKTEIADVSNLSADRAAFWANVPALAPEDISDAVLYVLGTPPNVQVHELTIKPNGEQF